MKEFVIDSYLEDIRKKIPAYDLMIEILFNSVLKVEDKILEIKDILSIGGQSLEIKNLSDIYKDSKITVVEPSEIMINIVKNECNNLKNLEYICDKFENYTNNKKDGQELIVLNGVVSLKNNYTNGILNGLSTSYYPDGTLRSTGQYVNNLRNGEWVWKYPDGTVKLVENYSNGKVNGNITGYYPDGNKERVFQVTNGNGNFTQYYDNGKLKAKGSIINYSNAGDWVFYDKNGNPVSSGEVIY